MTDGSFGVADLRPFTSLTPAAEQQAMSRLGASSLWNHSPLAWSCNVGRTVVTDWLGRQLSSAKAQLYNTAKALCRMDGKLSRDFEFTLTYSERAQPSVSLLHRVEYLPQVHAALGAN